MSEFWPKVHFDLDLDDLCMGSIQGSNGRFVDGVERQGSGVLSQQRDAYRCKHLDGQANVDSK
ncbi:MAG TPA: hypothetical protein VND64_19420 [Pirellulales bacterium]|nr:hypothetical protein [Pirellulales bacterium]